MVTIKINREYISMLSGPEAWDSAKKGVIVDEEKGIIDTGIGIKTKQIPYLTSFITKKLNEEDENRL